MDKTTFRFVERELYRYDLTKQRIEELRDALSYECSPAIREAVPGSGYISDPTARQAIKRVTASPALYQMENTIRAIELSLRRLSDSHRQIFNLKYQLDLPVQAVCLRMPVSESGYYKLRRQLVQKVAEELGYM